MKEEWKDIEEYKDVYQVSSLGNIRSLNRIDSINRDVRGRKLSTNIHGSGYVRVTFCKDGKYKNHNIHRLVAEAFIPNPRNLPMVLHGDDIKHHNWKTNLRWGTQQDNMDDMMSKRRHWRHKT